MLHKNINARTSLKTLLMCCVALNLTALVTTPAWADQDQADQTQQSKAAADDAADAAASADTGDHGNASMGVSKGDIAKSSTTKDLLRSMPSMGSFNASGNSVGQSASAVVASPAIHGLGGLTLMLLDGHRMAGASIYGTLPDPSAISPSAIERVEVNDEGASSVYGADAIVGVVNFVLKKDFDGARTNFKYGMGDGYQTWGVSQLLGKTWDTGSIMVTYDHAQNTHLAAYKRDYVTDNQTKYGYGDNRSTTCSPANITLDDVVYGLSTDGSVSTTTNKCEANIYNDLYPSMTHDQGLISLHQYLTPSIEFHANALYSYRIMSSRVGPTADTLSNGGLTVTVPSTSPYYVQIGDSTEDETVTYDPMNDVGVLQNNMIMNTISTTAGFQFNLGHSWMALVESTYGLEDDSADLPGINQTYVTEAAADGTLNPYGVGEANSAEVKKAVADYHEYATDRQTMVDTDIKLNGKLYDLPAGSINVQTGATLRVNTFAAYLRDGPKTESELLSSDAAEATVVTDANHRTSYAFYASVTVPFISSKNPMPLINGLSVTGSVRYDSYDDVGNTTNPRVVINWSPTDGLWLHGGYSTSFSPPSFTDSGHAIDSRVYRFSDQTGSSDTDAYALVLAGGNDSIKPSTSANWFVSGTYTPKFIPNLRLGISYFNIDYQNVIASCGGDVFSNTDSVYDDYRIYSPTEDEAEEWIAGYRQDGVFDITSKLPTAIYDVRRYNLYTEWIDGIDFSVNYAFETAYGQIGLGLQGNYLLDFDRTFNLTGATTSMLNTTTAVDLKSRTNISWSNGPYSVGFFINYTDGYHNTAVDTHPHVHSYTTLDMHLGWQVPYWKGTNLSVDVTNVFDTDPPHYYNGSETFAVTRGYDPGNASALGRVIQLSLTKDW